jgi:predicted nucleic acid-binding protein
MRAAFADTAFYIAMVNRRDSLHSAATDLARQFRGRIYTTEYVLIEVGNWLARSADRALFVELMRQLHADPHTTVIHAKHRLFELGLALYTRRPDKDWSFTDCISFIVMKQRRLADALTSDTHFLQAGFNALLG